MGKWQCVAMPEDIEKIFSKMVTTMKFKDLIETYNYMVKDFYTDDIK